MGFSVKSMGILTDFLIPTWMDQRFFQELLPEGRSFDALGRPLDVKVALQRQIDEACWAWQLWQAAACGDLGELRRALKAYQDPDVQDEQGEFLGKIAKDGWGRRTWARNS